MVYVACSWCQSFGDVSSMCFNIILVRFRFQSGNLWEIAAHSVDHMFSLYFDCFNSSYFPFWFLWLDLGSDYFSS